jgi:ribosomal protein L37AE/L43A
LSLFKKSEVDRKLKRGEPVTMQEIVSTYTTYEQTPWGQVIATPESVRKTVDKVAYAQSLGLLISDESDDAPSDAEARTAAMQELAGEPIQAEAVIKDVAPLTPEGANAYMLASANIVAWALMDRPDAVGSMRFSQVIDAEGERGRLNLTQRDPQYAASLNDASNPFGETDAAFHFPDTDEGHELHSWIAERLRALSPAWGDQRAMIARLAAVEGQAVETWERCPVCESPIGRRVEHGVQCSSCDYCFTDPNYEPVPDDSEPGVKIGGTMPWRPLLETQIEYRDRMLIWVRRPIGQAVGPPFIMAAELLSSMR